MTQEGTRSVHRVFTFTGLVRRKCVNAFCFLKKRYFKTIYPVIVCILVLFIWQLCSWDLISKGTLLAGMFFNVIYLFSMRCQDIRMGPIRPIQPTNDSYFRWIPQFCLRCTDIFSCHFKIGKVCEIHGSQRIQHDIGLYASSVVCNGLVKHSIPTNFLCISRRY